MGSRKEYWCDLCSEVATEPGQLYGLRFIGPNTFKVDGCRTTDGKHVCFRCAKQLVEQLRDVMKECA